MRWFLAGFAFGTALFAALMLGLVGDWVFAVLPRAWWFGANPVVFVVCDVLGRSDLCIGRGFDGGPLEWAELAWLWIAPGLLYGSVALVLRAAWRWRVRRSRQ